MTATTVAPDRSQLSRLSFGGIMKSEWIKLFTLRSTIWCYAILIFLNVALGLLIAATLTPSLVGGGNSQFFWVQAATLGIGFSQLVTVVLGALVITGEYGTGMIRSTFAAVPGRVAAVFAKALVFALVTFVIGLISIVATALLSAPLLAANGLAPDVTDGTAWVAMIGAAAYLALIGVLSLAIGVIIRNSAGAIASGLGLVLVAPAVLGIIGGITQAAWMQNVVAVLPTSAGSRVYAYELAGSDSLPLLSSDGVLHFEPWQGGLVLVAWVVVLGILATVLVKKRDA
ncbi:MAG TPA: ABC transporter permease [Pseudolysinimonas sp.]|nr:ABC transporter permease [Pseudolysinimonas sp.]